MDITYKDLMTVAILVGFILAVYIMRLHVQLSRTEHDLKTKNVMYNQSIATLVQTKEEVFELRRLKNKVSEFIKDNEKQIMEWFDAPVK